MARAIFKLWQSIVQTWISGAEAVVIMWCRLDRVLVIVWQSKMWCRCGMGYSICEAVQRFGADVAWLL
jgi:hypothetical protein